MKNDTYIFEYDDVRDALNFADKLIDRMTAFLVKYPEKIFTSSIERSENDSWIYTVNIKDKNYESENENISEEIIRTFKIL